MSSARIFSSVSQFIVTGDGGGHDFPTNWQTIIFDTIRWDTGGFVVGSGIVIPSTGYYRLGAAFQVGSPAAGSLFAGFEVGGSFIYGRSLGFGPWTRPHTGMSLETDWHFTGGDAISLKCAGNEDFNSFTVLSIFAYSAEMWISGISSP